MHSGDPEVLEAGGNALKSRSISYISKWLNFLKNKHQTFLFLSSGGNYVYITILEEYIFIHFNVTTSTKVYTRLFRITCVLRTRLLIGCLQGLNNRAI